MYGGDIARFDRLYDIDDIATNVSAKDILYRIAINSSISFAPFESRQRDIDAYDWC